MINIEFINNKNKIHLFNIMLYTIYLLFLKKLKITLYFIRIVLLNSLRHESVRAILLCYKFKINDKSLYDLEKSTFMSFIK